MGESFTAKVFFLKYFKNENFFNFFLFFFNILNIYKIFVLF